METLNLFFFLRERKDKEEKPLLEVNSPHDNTNSFRRYSP